MADKKNDLPEAPQDPAPGTFEPGDVPAPVVDRHPASIKGYDVLDLTDAYNQGHPDTPVAGLFRVTCQADTEVNADVATDGRYYVYGQPGHLTAASEQLINATIDRLEALRKV